MGKMVKQEVYMEIERKFLVKQLPENLAQYPCRHISQAYVCTDPVIRVRQKDENYILTIKGEGFLQREEFEMPLQKAQYKRLLAKAEGRSIAKDRYCIPFGKYTIELDIFAPPFDPLVLAEVEFASVEEATAFVAPDWFGEEVTHENEYTNASISRKRLEVPYIVPGRYRHFKGKEYEVLGMASHSETLEPMVVYRALYGECGVWVRPATMWTEEVEHEGRRMPRFSRITE